MRDHLYYYSSPVRKNLSSKFDEFLAARSKFDSDHRVDFYTHTCCQSAITGPLFLRFIVLCLLRFFFNNVAFRQMRSQPFNIQPAIFPQLTWGGHFTGGSLTPPISACMNHCFRVARSRKLCRKLDATKLYPTEPFSSSHHAMFKPTAGDVTM